MISIEASVSKGWLHQSAGFLFDNKYYFDPVYRWEQDSLIHEFVKEKFPNYPIYNMEANLMQAKHMIVSHVLRLHQIRLHVVNWIVWKLFPDKFVYQHILFQPVYGVEIIFIIEKKTC